jgi:hypothetical protein
MKKKKLILIVIFSTILIIEYAVYSLYYIVPIDKAKPQIQLYLNKKYNNKFQIVTIEKDYCPDLFHQPWGYKLTLKDSGNIEFSNILIEYNKYQKNWLTYGGTDIEAEYIKQLSFMKFGLSSNYFQYFPTYEKEGQFIKDRKPFNKKHFEAIKQVLTYYKYNFKDFNGLVFYEGIITDELLWNYTTKANDSIWLSSHK